MKIQIKYNITDLDRALEIAQATAAYTDIMGIGSLLLYKNGIKAVEAFAQTFPNKELFVDSKITDQAEDAIRLFAQAGATYISVLAETHPSVIRTACAIAHECKTRIILDCMNHQAIGQSALDAKPLGAYGILLHQATNAEAQQYSDAELEELCANINLPIFIKGKITNDTLHTLKRINPYAVIISDSITRTTDPRSEAETIQKLIL